MSSPSLPIRLAANRYEVGEELDRGGMGTVFIAYDTYQNRRKVALKTITGAAEGTHLELFQRELSVLASLSHPNIVDVYDSGYLDVDGGGSRKPFFVMPLLQGQTLDQRLRGMGGRGHFTVDESIRIIDQVSRGLMAAHGRGIIHRDLKPSNIFVLPDLSVKVIDFGVAQLIGANTKSGQKGTLLYMAPEQVAENQSSAFSDQFSLGAVFYEILTGRRAFERDNEKKVIDAILHEIPPIATELDRDVPMVISQIVHKMLAKKPDRRFASIQDLIETLQKSIRREPIEYFNPDNFEQSFQSARAAFQRKNYELASEILYTIEAEGYVDAEALRMRQEALAAIRGSRVARDLKHAHELVDDGNYVLASEKIASVLATDQENVDALALEKEVRKKLEAQNISTLKKLARLHIANRNFDRGRESLERVLKLNETDSEALQMLNEVDRQDLEFRRLIDKQQDLYQSARHAWQHGEVTSALNKIERVLSLDSDLQSPDPDQRTAYERFYQEVRARADSLRTARVEIQRSVDRRDFSKAREVCDGVLAEDPNNAAFQALRVDIEDRHQRALLETIAEVDAKLGREPRLDQRLKVLEDAVALFPGEPHFDLHLQATRRKQDTVNRMVEKARLLEDQHRYEEAVNLWEIVETTYPAFPGMQVELQRVHDLRAEKRREERCAELTLEVARYLEFSDFDKAESAVRDAGVELPGDRVVEDLTRRVAERRNNSEEAARLLEQGRGARESKDLPGAVEALRRAFKFEPRDREVRAEYLFTLAAMARQEAANDPLRARALTVEGLRAEPAHTGLRTLADQLDSQLKDADLVKIIDRAEQALMRGELSGAASAVEEGFRISPDDRRLEEIKHRTDTELTRLRDLETLQRIQFGLAEPELVPVEVVQTRLAEVHKIGERSGGDRTIAALSDDLSQKLASLVSRLRTDSDPRVTQMELQSPPMQAATIIDVPPIDTIPLPAAPPPPIIATPVVNYPGPTIKTGSQMPAVVLPAAPPKRWPWIALAVAALAGLAIFGGVLLKGRLPLAPNPVELTVEAEPAGAEISIDGVAMGEAPLTRKLARGEHRVEARRKGFKDLTQTVKLAANADKLALIMEPDGIPIHFVTDLRGMSIKADGKVLSDEEQRSLAQGMLKLEDASHLIDIASGSIAARIAIAVKAGKIEIRGPAMTNQTKAAVLATFGPAAAPRWSLPSDAEVLVDGVSISKEPATPLAEGKHQLKMGNFEGSFEIGAAPGVWVFLSSGKLYGHLAINSNVADADIYLDGEKNNLRTPATIPSVQVRNVRLRVEKAGYEPYNAVVPIIAGSTAPVFASLKPKAKTAP